MSRHRAVIVLLSGDRTAWVYCNYSLSLKTDWLLRDYHKLSTIYCLVFARRLSGLFMNHKGSVRISGNDRPILWLLSVKSIRQKSSGDRLIYDHARYQIKNRPASAKSSNPPMLQKSLNCAAPVFICGLSISQSSARKTRFSQFSQPFCSNICM